MQQILLILSLILLSGCASTSTFHPYPSQINPLIQKVEGDIPIDFKKEFKGKLRSKDKVLYLLESGRIAQIRGDIFQSKQSFQAAEQAIKDMDRKALLSASGAFAQTSSFLVNDNALPYRPASYERVLLNLYQAMNYVYQNDLEDAAVEVRQANLEQEEALRVHLKEIDAAKQRAQKEGTNLPASVTNTYAQLDVVAGQTKNSFQNAYTFYLSGLIYEMVGQRDDAFIDYKRALEMVPNNSYVQKDVARLDRQVNFNQKPDSSGELIVLFEDGFVPQKEEVKIPIPVSLENINFIAVGFPMYSPHAIESFPLTLYENGVPLAQSEAISNITALAMKALNERILTTTTHQIIRAASKAIFAKQAERELGGIGALAATAYNYFSESADLRSWSTLPSTVHIMRLSLPAGEHEFSFLQRETGSNIYIKTTIKENIKKIIRIVRAGNKLYYINLT